MSEVNTLSIKDSPAYQVLRLPTRRLLDTILHEIDRHGGRVPIASDQFEAQGIGRMSLEFGLSQLQALGLVTVTGGSYGPNTFGLCNRWQEISATDAERISARYA